MQITFILLSFFTIMEANKLTVTHCNTCNTCNSCNTCYSVTTVTIQIQTPENKYIRLFLFL